jgi:hypothetical protein
MDALILACIGLSLLAGFFTGIEVAFLSANKISIELKKAGRSGRILQNSLIPRLNSSELPDRDQPCYGNLQPVGAFTSSWNWVQDFFVKKQPYFIYIRLVFDTLMTIIIMVVKFSFGALFRAKMIPCWHFAH